MCASLPKMARVMQDSGSVRHANCCLLAVHEFAIRVQAATSSIRVFTAWNTDSMVQGLGRVMRAHQGNMSQVSLANRCYGCTYLRVSQHEVRLSGAAADVHGHAPAPACLRHETCPMHACTCTHISWVPAHGPCMHSICACPNARIHGRHQTAQALSARVVVTYRMQCSQEIAQAGAKLVRATLYHRVYAWHVASAAWI